MVLKNTLQDTDNVYADQLKIPRVRFEERAGPTINDELGKSNPWAGQWVCPRADCLPCLSRGWLNQETELLRERPKESPRPHKDETKSLPSCTKEGIVYTIECVTCREKGVR